jgi:hypothetical protein
MSNAKAIRMISGCCLSQRHTPERCCFRALRGQMGGNEREPKFGLRNASQNGSLNNSSNVTVGLTTLAIQVTIRRWKERP